MGVALPSGWDIADLSAAGFAVDQFPKWNGTEFVPVDAPGYSAYRTIRVEKDGSGDFTTIKAACDYAGITHTGTEPDYVLVGGGGYFEDPFTVPAYCFVIGRSYPVHSSGALGTRIAPNTATYTAGNFITMSSGSALVNIVVLGIAGTATGDLVLINGSSYTLRDISIQSFAAAGAFTLRYIKSTSSLFIGNSVLVGGGSGTDMVLLEATAGTLIVDNCRLIPGSPTTCTGIRTAATTNGIQYVRIGSGTGGAFPTYDLDIQGGVSVYINNSPMSKVNNPATAIFLDKWKISRSGIHQAVTANDTPINVVEAAGQVVDPIMLSDSLLNQLMGVSPAGVVKAPGFTSLSSGPASLSGGLLSPYTRTVVVDINGKGDFSNIQDACTYVSTQSPSATSVWAIVVMPGLYTATFEVPQYTVVRSDSGVMSAYNPVLLKFGTTVQSGNCIVLNNESQLLGCFVEYAPAGGFQTGDVTLLSVKGAGLRIHYCYLYMFANSAFDLHIFSRNAALVGFTIIRAHFCHIYANNSGAGSGYGFKYVSDTNYFYIRWCYTEAERWLCGPSGIMYFHLSPINGILETTGGGIISAAGSPHITGSVVAGSDVRYANDVRTNAQGRYTAGAVDVTPGTFKGMLGQTADIVKAVASTDALQFGVGATGHIKSNQKIAASAISATIVAVLPVYDEADVLIGYMSVHDGYTP